MIWACLESNLGFNRTTELWQHILDCQKEQTKMVQPRDKNLTRFMGSRRRMSCRTLELSSLLRNEFLKN